MTDGNPPDRGWFEGVDPADVDGAATAVRDGTATEPRDWPAAAVRCGFAGDEAAYYDRLRAATVRATREAVRERERADDQQLIHAVRAMDDAGRVANELAERVAEWAGSLGIDADQDDGGGDGGVELARAIAGSGADSGSAGTDSAPTGTDSGSTGSGSASTGANSAPGESDQGDAVERRVRSLAARVADLADERDELRAFVETTAPAVAPNLAAMAGPVLAARLIALAGGLESLARKPSGTLQVLGAEDALFAHLRGQAPSPKHGVIYTHEYVRGTRPEKRGAAARTLAGKLTIAARVDHYSGERRPDLDRELEARMARIRGGGEDGGDDAAAAGGDGQ